MYVCIAFPLFIECIYGYRYFIQCQSNIINIDFNKIDAAEHKYVVCILVYHQPIAIYR